MTLAEQIRALKLETDGNSDFTWNTALDRAAELAEAHESALVAAADHQRENKDQAYHERNMLVALLASMFPSGRARTEIEGWNPEWYGCVYIDFPWGQASWHFHDSQAGLFAHLPPYAGQWDGHTTEAKYAAIVGAATTGDVRLTRERDAAAAAALERAEQCVLAKGKRIHDTLGASASMVFGVIAGEIHALPHDTSALDAVVAERTAGLRAAVLAEVRAAIAAASWADGEIDSYGAEELQAALAKIGGQG